MSSEQSDDAALLELARERYADSLEAYQEDWDTGEEDLLFLTGEGHWPEDVLNERIAEGRPTVTVPHLPRFINQVEGDLRQNKISAKVAGREDDDADSAEVAEGLIRTIEDISDAGSVYATAGVSAASCGFGWFRLSIIDEDEDSFDRSLLIKRIKNPFAVVMDPHIDHETGEDARFAFVRETMPRTEFEALYPDADTSQLFEMDSKQQWLSEDRVTVAEYWTCEDEEYDLALLADGTYLPLEEVPEGVEPYMVRKKTRKRVEMRMITGNSVLEPAKRWPGKRIPLFPVWGREVHVGDRVKRMSLIHHAKDGQRALNYARSAEMEMAALSPKVPYIVTDTMIQGREEEWAEANQGARPYLTYTPDPKMPGGPRRELPPQPSAAMYQLSAAAVQDMKDATGIYDASLGERSNETSGVAIRARQREADTGTFVFMDNMRRAVQSCAKEMLALLPIIYDAPRTIRILGADMQNKVVRINQPDENGRVVSFNGKYDLSITTGAAFGTRREESVAAMTQFIQAAPDAAKFVLDIIARNSDWPGAGELEERLKKMLPPELLNEDDAATAQIQNLQQQVQQLTAVLQSVQQQPEMMKAQAEATEATYDAEKARLEVAETAVRMMKESGEIDQMMAAAAQQGAQMALRQLGVVTNV